MPYKTTEVPESDKTPWQDGNPPCQGLWERRTTRGHCLSYWDGATWYLGSFRNSVEDAMRYYRRGNESILTSPQWRGLNFDPALGAGTST